jgi:single-stranded-DNA-specific exonuclease
LNIEWFLASKGSILAENFLLITVDCGISNAIQIEKIKRLGGTVIVTDHHNLPESGVPQCLILNPSQPSCGFHQEQLAGVGVAFYLAAGIRAEYADRLDAEKFQEKVNLKNYLALVALGTIADVVDLTPTNRILVRAGLEALASTPFPGLQELLASCEIGKGDITSEDIGYLIGPKINAAGRLGESDLVVNILIEKDRKRAKKYIQKLTELNEQRRRISADNLETALNVVSSSKVEDEKSVIVKGDMHQGVAGIVASRLVEIYGVPAMVFAEKSTANGLEIYVGSARSIAGMNILEMINMCSRWIDRFGGHEMAAGLSVRKENMPGFEAAFAAVAREAWQKRTPVRKQRFDIECSVENLMTEENMAFFKLLEPFGPGNLQPVFYDNSARIVDSKTVGKGSEHLHLTIRGKYANLKGIGFSLGSRIVEVQKDPMRRMLYVPTMNRFRGNVSWQVRVIDL